MVVGVCTWLFLTNAASAGLVWTGDVADDSVSGVSTADARAAASLLDDPWRSTVTADLLAQGYIGSQLTIESADILHPTTDIASGGTGMLGSSSAFSNGVTFDYTLVNTKSGDLDLGTPETSTVREWKVRVGDLKEQAPTPTEMVGFTGLTEQAGQNAITSPLPLNGVLLEFSRDLENFGIFIGDVASRSTSVLAEVRLFDSSNALLLQQKLQYSGKILTDGVGGSTSYTEGDTSPAGNNLNRWGDDQTAFIGYSNISNVRRMLIVVGEDERLKQGADEHLSFVGASIGFGTASVPEPSSICLMLIAGVLGIGRRTRH